MFRNSSLKKQGKTISKEKIFSPKQKMLRGNQGPEGNDLWRSNSFDPKPFFKKKISSQVQSLAFLSSFQQFEGTPTFPFPPHTMPLRSQQQQAHLPAEWHSWPGAHAHLDPHPTVLHIYTVSILGNCTIIFIIKTEPPLHEPMYLFLSMLALIDLGCLCAPSPTRSWASWVGARDIGHDACFAQPFSFTACPSWSPLYYCLPLDRQAAPCTMLPFSPTQSLAGSSGFVGSQCSTHYSFYLLVLKRFPYCGSQSSHISYCLHQEVMKLACADIRANSIYGMLSSFLTVGIDSTAHSLFSYALILRTVLSIASSSRGSKLLTPVFPTACAVLLSHSHDWPVCHPPLWEAGTSSGPGGFWALCIFSFLWWIPSSTVWRPNRSAIVWPTPFVSSLV